MKILKTLLFGLLVIIIITISMKNTGNVRLRYFNVIDPFEIPLFLLILLSILFGMFIGAMVDLIKRRQLRKTIRRQQKAMDDLHKEVTALRNLILTGSENEKGEETKGQRAELP